jgi:uncharacterized membrane protein
MKINKYLFILLIILCVCKFPYITKAEDSTYKYLPVKAKVIEVMNTPEMQEVTLEILEGHFKGNIIITSNPLTLSKDKPLNLSLNDKVLVVVTTDVEGDLSGGYIHEYIRENYLIYLAAAFILFLICIGGFKGIKAVITLFITAAAVIKIFLPAILSGKSPVLMAVLISVGITILCLVILNGFSKKSITAIIGTLGGILSAGIISHIMIMSTKLSGLGGEESFMLTRIPQSTNFNFRGLLFAGIILGALGAVMDISMSIASALHEITENNPNISSKELLISGMNVGKDTMGTMANTLILAYTGGSLNMLLLFMAYDISLAEIINSQEISGEIIRALSGSIGLIFAIPITVISAIILYKNKSKVVSRPSYYYKR